MMDERTADKIINATHWPRVMATAALGLLALFLLVATFGELKSYRYIGSGIAPTNTISVSGEGDVFAVPDTATFTFTVDETATDVATAQANASTKENAIIAYLKAQGIADTDIQTTDYEVNPQYSNQQSVCPQPIYIGASGGASVSGIYCPPGKQTLTGYDVTQTVSVAVHDTSKAGAILAGVGSKGASNVSGLSLAVSNQVALEIQARDKAIADAQGKAQDLAKSLGVTLVRIVGYSDNSGGGIVPYAVNMAMGAVPSAAPAPKLPPGQNKITSDVSITYEIQ